MVNAYRIIKNFMKISKLQVMAYIFPAYNLGKVLRMVYFLVSLIVLSEQNVLLYY